MDPKDGCEAKLDYDVNNCGACGAQCKFANASAGCGPSQQGMSGCYLKACSYGFDDCNGDSKDGCETSTSSDVKNCGGCGMTCAAVPHATVGCVNSVCSLTGCNQGWSDCDNNAKNGCETQTGNDNKNCGKCGNACVQGQICINSSCTCANCSFNNAKSKCVNNVCLFDQCLPNWGDCDFNVNNGCEADLTADANNCGACGNVCPQNKAFCFNSQCSAYVLPAECNNATKVDDAGRNVMNEFNVICDNNMGNNWYQFVNATGTKMPTAPPAELHCSTHAPGWINGNYPNFGDGKVTRTVCFNWAGNQCQWSVNIQVINCGQSYVFQLPNTPVCNLRYCGTN
jgi:hypothetical protein